MVHEDDPFDDAPLMMQGELPGMPEYDVMASAVGVIDSALEVVRSTLAMKRAERALLQDQIRGLVADEARLTRLHRIAHEKAKESPEDGGE